MIIRTYKKSFAYLLFLIILFSQLSSSAVGDNLDFDRLKTATLTMLDNSISRVDNAINTINNNPRLDQTTKDNIVSNLTAMKTSLNNYKTEVEGATTLVQIREINQEIVQYIKDNRDIIRNNIRMALINLGEKTIQKAKEFIDEVEKLLELMENRTCTEQAEKINEVESQLESLRTSLTTLEDAVKNKNTVLIKQEVRKIKDLSKLIFDNMKILEEMC